MDVSYTRDNRIVIMLIAIFKLNSKSNLNAEVSSAAFPILIELLSGPILTS